MHKCGTKQGQKHALEKGEKCHFYYQTIVVSNLPNYGSHKFISTQSAAFTGSKKPDVKKSFQAVIADAAAAHFFLYLECTRINE